MKYCMVILLLLVVGCGKNEEEVSSAGQSEEDVAIAALRKAASAGIPSIRIINSDNSRNVMILKKHGSVIHVEISGTAISDADLVHLKALPNLESLIFHRTNITGAGLKHLKGLTKLVALDLEDTQITDAGLVHLKSLINLESLDLSNRDISGSGLKHLEGLTNLRNLFLINTKVTDAGVAELKKALPNCLINAQSTNPSDYVSCLNCARSCRIGMKNCPGCGAELRD